MPALCCAKWSPDVRMIWGLCRHRVLTRPFQGHCIPLPRAHQLISEAQPCCVIWKDFPGATPYPLPLQESKATELLLGPSVGLTESLRSTSTLRPCPRKQSPLRGRGRGCVEGGRGTGAPVGTRTTSPLGGRCRVVCRRGCRAAWGALLGGDMVVFNHGGQASPTL